MKDGELYNRIVQRILRESNIPELMEVLTERISMTDLQSGFGFPKALKKHLEYVFLTTYSWNAEAKWSGQKRGFTVNVCCDGLQPSLTLMLSGA